MAWTSNGYVPITDGTGGATRYETFYADGQAYRLPVAECPSVACTGGSTIAWESMDTADQAALAAYSLAAERQMLEDGAKLATVATLASPIGMSRLTLASLASRQTAVAFGVGAGFQSAGDYYKNDGVDPGNSLIAGATAALAFPLLRGSIMTNSLIGGATLGTNAMAQNRLLGADESVATNYRLGLIFSGAGTIAGHGGTWAVGQIAPQFVRNGPLKPAVPALLQAPAQLNPVPGQAGTSIDALISNIPPFLDTSKQEGGP